MSENSKIEWCDHTFNPWIGCTKVSPGCAHCYAEAQMDKRLGKVHWGPGQPRQRTSAANWKLPFKWNAAEDRKLVSHGDFVANRRPRVFCASLADILDPEVPAKWVADLADLILCTPSIDWLLLTKRPELWRARIDAALEAMAADSKFSIETRDALCLWKDNHGAPPANVWIGTTVEDQQRADERIPALLNIPAAIRFLSCEPLLGDIDLMTFLDPIDGGYLGKSFIDWVICGGESGPNARPMHLDWARSLRDQCEEAGVPFLFKQWGEWAPVQRKDDDSGLIDVAGTEYAFQDVPEDWPTFNPVKGKGWWWQKSDPFGFFHKTGKHRSGRLLDGREHNEFPRT